MYLINSIKSVCVLFSYRDSLANNIAYRKYRTFFAVNNDLYDEINSLMEK